MSRLNTNYYDVVIYGGTIAGICAAIQAVNNGMKTLILEPTSYIGGMSGPGSLTPIDTKFRIKTGGTVWQMIQRMAVRETTATRFMPTILPPSLTSTDPNYYQLTMESVGTKNFWRVLYEFVFASNADILINAPLETTGGSILSAVNMIGSTIISLSTVLGVAQGRQFIDATYEGDILASVAYQGQASWAVGRESSAQYNESYAGFYPNNIVTIAGMNFLNNGSPYFPLTFYPNNITQGSADLRIQPYNYRPQISLASNHTVRPFFKPDNYDPAQFAITAAVANAVGYTHLTDCCGLAITNGGEFNYNDGGTQYSHCLWNQGIDYPTANPARRAQIASQYKTYTQGLLYFAATDPSMPLAVNADAQLYGYPTENFANNNNFPEQMYVRESIRMIGSYVLTQNDMINGTLKPHPIGWTTYYTDIHTCGVYIASDGSGFYNDGFFFDSTLGEAQIPMEALMPQAGQCGNLLVPVCASTSHVAWGPYRMETTFGIAGDAVGVMAAAAVNTGKTVQALNYTTDVLPGLIAARANIT